MISKKQPSRGFAVVEMLVAIFVLALLSAAVFSAATVAIKSSLTNEYLVVAQRLATDDSERIRLMEYDAVVAASETITQNGQGYTLTRTITLVDDPANGTVGGTLAEDNADHKLVEIVVDPPGTAGRPTQLTVLVTRPTQPLVLPAPAVHLPLERPGEVNEFYSEIVGDAYPVVTDVSGSYNGQTIFKAYSYINANVARLSGFSKYYLDFDPPSAIDGEYIGNFSGGFPVDVTKSFTISLWINPSNSSPMGIIAVPYRVKLRKEFNAVRLNFSNNSSCLNDSDNLFVEAFSPRTLVSGQWTHVAAVRDAAAGNITMYLDGVKGDVTNTPFAPASSCGTNLLVGTNRLGQFNRTVDPFKGNMDDIRIFDAALTEKQIKALAGV